MNWTSLGNSLAVSALATLLSVGCGWVVALAGVSVEARRRRWLIAGVVTSLALPPFLVTNCWLDLAANDVWWGNWIPFPIHSLGGAVWLLALLTWPITTLFLLGAWSHVEPSHLESEPALRGTALLRWLLWPMGRGPTGFAALIAFVLALNNFAIPVILQVKVLPEELWLAFTTRLDETGAWLASIPLILFPTLILLAFRRATIPWPRKEPAAAARAIRNQLGPACLWPCWAATGLLLFVALALPLRGLVLDSRTWTELPNVFRAVPGTIWNSFLYAAATATACLVISFAGWRLPIGRLLWLPFLIPGVLLARLSITTFNGTMLYGTASLVTLAFTLRYLAISWHGMAYAMGRLDRDLIDTARLDGLSGWSLFRHVHWPQIASRVGVAWYVTYLLCLWDVETLVLIHPPGGETLALRIFNLLHYGHNAQVNALCLTLLALALMPLAGSWAARSMKRWWKR